MKSLEPFHLCMFMSSTASNVSVESPSLLDLRDQGRRELAAETKAGTKQEMQFFISGLEISPIKKHKKTFRMSMLTFVTNYLKCNQLQHMVLLFFRVRNVKFSWDKTQRVSNARIENQVAWFTTKQGKLYNQIFQILEHPL